MAGSALQMDTHPKFERESDMGRPVFQETDPNSLFSMVYFYALRCYAKSCGVSSPDFYQSQVLHTNVYKGLGLLTIYDPLLVTAVSQPGHLFLQG